MKVFHVSGEDVPTSSSRSLRSVKTSHESSDDYRGLVVQLNPLWRVVECRDGIQWIVQRSDGMRDGRRRWTGRSYFRSRDALIRACRALVGSYEATAIDTLESLPNWIEGAA